MIARHARLRYAWSLLTVLSWVRSESGGNDVGLRANAMPNNPIYQRDIRFWELSYFIDSLYLVQCRAHYELPTMHCKRESYEAKENAQRTAGQYRAPIGCASAVIDRHQRSC